MAEQTNEERFDTNEYLLSLLTDRAGVSKASAGPPAPPPPAAMPPGAAPTGPGGAVPPPGPAGVQSDDTTQVVGEPLPAEMIQQGAAQMEPPPGATSGMPPEGGADPLMQAMQMLEQIGMIMESGFGAMVPLLQQIATGIESLEKQLLIQTGSQLGEDAVQAAMPTPSAQPAVPGKTASGRMVSARARDGELSSAQGRNVMDLNERIRHATSVANALQILHQENG